MEINFPLVETHDSCSSARRRRVGSSVGKRKQYDWCSPRPTRPQKLMKLRNTKSFCASIRHDRGIGNIYTNFYNRCWNEKIKFFSWNKRIISSFFLWKAFAHTKTNAKMRTFFTKTLCFFLLQLLHQSHQTLLRADTTNPCLPFATSVSIKRITCSRPEGGTTLWDWLSSGWKFGENRKCLITISNHSKGSWDRRGCHL